MEYLYAVLLLHEAGKEINADNIRKVLESVGVQVNEAMLNAVVSSLEGVDLEKIKEEALAVPAAPVATAAPVQAQAQEEKKEEKSEEEEKKEEQALEGLGTLFGF
ncbi:MAG TPA: 50S ribosomal protein P1 [Candidatus Nanopusillus sp.]|nr:50S ribosomal protein P1 [Candidatus Nanopusillus sp.]HIP90184.1 50S ribosomal protein P1 [Candidatus Nanopusillus sp.]